MSDKEGSMSMEHEVTMSDIKEVQVTLGAGAEDKPNCLESSVESIPVKTLTRMDPNPDKQGSVTETEQNVTMAMSAMRELDLGLGAGVEDNSTREENLGADVEQLIQARKEAQEQKLITRRAAWQEQVKAELEKRAEFKRQMEGTPRNNITSCKDKQTLSKISQKWRNEFLSERTQFLFSEVMPSLPQHHFTFKEILNCRLVSKLWKDPIDSWLSITSIITACHFQDEFTTCTMFFTDGQIQSFNRKNEALSRRGYRIINPVPFHQLFIGAPKGHGNLGTTYWIEMGKLLIHWGKEIWSAFYVFDDRSIEMMYEFLNKFLSLMPNLRELVIMERGLGKNPEAGQLEVRFPREAVFRVFKSRMERKPLPELPHLHTLGLGGFLPAPLIEAALTKYRDTLESVRIEDPGPGLNMTSKEYADPGQFVSGRRLPITKYSCIYADAFRLTQWDFQFPELCELELQYIMASGRKADIENIFKTVNSSGSSIRRLRLKIHFNVPVPNCANEWRDLLPAGMKLELPHLESLNLTLKLTKVSDVDFLLPLVSLKELTFTYLTMGSASEASTKDGSGIIQFTGYRDRFYDSNIWTMLPELKLVTLNSINFNERLGKYSDYSFREPYEAGLVPSNMISTVHTRDGYRQHQSNQKGIQLGIEQLAAFTAK